MNRFGPGDPWIGSQMATMSSNRFVPPRILYDRNFEPIRMPPPAPHFYNPPMEIRPCHSHIQSHNEMRMREEECLRRDMEFPGTEQIENLQWQEFEQRRQLEMEHLKNQERELQWNQELDYRGFDNMEFVRIQERRTGQLGENEHSTLHDTEYFRSQELENRQRLQEMKHRFQELEYRKQESNNYNHGGDFNYCSFGAELTKPNPSKPLPQKKQKRKAKSKRKKGNGNKNETKGNSNPLKEINSDVTDSAVDRSSQKADSKKQTKSGNQLKTISTTVASSEMSGKVRVSQAAKTNLCTENTSNVEIMGTCASQSSKIETLVSAITTNQGLNSSHKKKKKKKKKKKNNSNMDQKPVIKAEETKEKDISEKESEIRKKSSSNSNKLSICSENIAAKVVPADKTLQSQQLNESVPVVDQGKPDGSSNSKPEKLEADKGKLCGRNFIIDISDSPPSTSEMGQNRQSKNETILSEKKDEIEVENPGINLADEKTPNKHKRAISAIIYDNPYSKICDPITKQASSSDKTMLTDTNSKSSCNGMKTCPSTPVSHGSDLLKITSNPVCITAKQPESNSSKDSQSFDKNSDDKNNNSIEPGDANNAPEKSNDLPAKIIKSDKFDALMILERKKENRKISIESTGSDCDKNKVGNRKNINSLSKADVASPRKESTHEKNEKDNRQNNDARSSILNRNSSSTSSNATPLKSNRCHGSHELSLVDISPSRRLESYKRIRHGSTSNEAMFCKRSESNISGSRSSSTKHYRHRKDSERENSLSQREKSKELTPKKKCSSERSPNNKSRGQTRTYDERNTARESGDRNIARGSGDRNIARKMARESGDRNMARERDERNITRERDDRNIARERDDRKMHRSRWDSDSRIRQKSRHYNKSPDNIEERHSSEDDHDAQPYVSSQTQEKKRERKVLKRNQHVDISKTLKRISKDYYEIIDSDDTDLSDASSTGPSHPSDFKGKENPVDFLLSTLEKSKDKLNNEKSKMSKKLSPIDYLLKKFNEPITKTRSTTQQLSEDIAPSFGNSHPVSTAEADCVLLNQNSCDKNKIVESITKPKLLNQNASVNNKIDESITKPCSSDTSFNLPQQLNLQTLDGSNTLKSNDSLPSCDSVQICQDSNLKLLPSTQLEKQASETNESKLLAVSSKEDGCKSMETTKVNESIGVKTSNKKEKVLVEYITPTRKVQNDSRKNSLDQRINKLMETLNSKTSSAELPSSFIPIVNGDKEEKSFTETQQKQDIVPVTTKTVSNCESFSIDFSKCETLLSPNSLNLMSKEHFVYDQTKNDGNPGKFMLESKPGRSAMKSVEKGSPKSSSGSLGNKKKDFLSAQKSNDSDIVSKPIEGKVKEIAHNVDSIQKLSTDIPNPMGKCSTNETDLVSAIRKDRQDKEAQSPKTNSTKSVKCLLSPSVIYVDSSPDSKHFSVTTKVTNTLISNKTNSVYSENSLPLTKHLSVTRKDPKTLKSQNTDSVYSENNLPQSICVTSTGERGGNQDYITSKTCDLGSNSSFLSESCSSKDSKNVMNETIDQKLHDCGSDYVSISLPHAKVDGDKDVLKTSHLIADSSSHKVNDTNSVKKRALGLSKDNLLSRAPGRDARKYASQFCEIMSKYEAVPSSTGDSTFSTSKDESEAPSSTYTLESIVEESHLCSVDININPTDHEQTSKMESENVKAISPLSNAVISRPSRNSSLRKYADIFCKSMALYEEQIGNSATNHHVNEPDDCFANVSSDHNEVRTSVCEETTENMVDVDDSVDRTYSCTPKNTEKISNLANDVELTIVDSQYEEANSSHLLRGSSENSSVIEIKMKPNGAIPERHVSSKKMNKPTTNIDLKSKAIDEIVKDFPEKNRERRREILTKFRSENKIKGRKTKLIYLEGPEKLNTPEVCNKPSNNSKVAPKNINSRDVSKSEDQSTEGIPHSNKNTLVGCKQNNDHFLTRISEDITSNIENSVPRRPKPIVRRQISLPSSSPSTLVDSIRPLHQDLTNSLVEKVKKRVISSSPNRKRHLSLPTKMATELPIKENNVSEKISVISPATKSEHQSNLAPLVQKDHSKEVTERKKIISKVNYDCDLFSSMDKYPDTNSSKFKKKAKSRSMRKRSLDDQNENSSSLSTDSQRCTEKRKISPHARQVNSGNSSSSLQSKNPAKIHPLMENPGFGNVGKSKSSVTTTKKNEKEIQSSSSIDGCTASTMKKHLKKWCSIERKEASKSNTSTSQKTHTSKNTKRPNYLKKVSKFSKKNFLKLKTLKECELKKKRRRKTKLHLLKGESITGTTLKKSQTTNNTGQKTSKWKRIKIKDDQEYFISDKKKQNLSYTISRSHSCPATSQQIITPQKHRTITKGRHERQNSKYESEGISQKDGFLRCLSYPQGTHFSSPSKNAESFSGCMSLDMQNNFDTPDKMRIEARKSLPLQKNEGEKFKKNLSTSPFVKNKLEKKTTPEKNKSDSVPSGLHSTKTVVLNSETREIDIMKQTSCIPSLLQVEVDLNAGVKSLEPIAMSSVNYNTATADYDSDDSLCLQMSPLGGDCMDLDNDLEPVIHFGFSPFIETERKTADTVSEVNNNGNEGNSSQMSSQVPGTMAGSSALDDLLAEKEEIEVKNRDIFLMKIELKEGIERGGFVQVLQDAETAEAEEFLPEQKKALETLQVFESEIKERHPGEEVFHTELYQQLFQPSLSPTDCGFKKGNSMIDALLSNLETELLADFLTSGVLTMCFHKVSCPEIICQWLFYTLSISGNILVVHSCQRILMDLIQTQTADTPDLYTWCPKPLDLLKIFINYGAEQNFILPDEQLYSKEEIGSSLLPSANHQKSGDIGLNLIGRDNFLGVLETLSFALQARPEVEREEITAFIELIVRAAMDKSFNSNKFHYEFQVAIASALHCYDKSTWDDVVPDLCKRLSQVTKHHHNKVYLAQLLPPGSRGLCIQRRVAAMFLHEEMTGEVMASCPDTIEIKSLFQYVDHMKAMIKELDLYKLSSCIVLMDLVVGVEKLSGEQKDHLEQLSERISYLKGDLRDSVQMMDKTRVKDLMVRTSSKWTLMIQTMGCMQTHLFPWTKNKYVQEMKIERLEVESDDESESSDAEKNPTKAGICSVGDSKTCVTETDNHNLQTKATELVSETSSSANNESKTKHICTDDTILGSNQKSTEKLVPICETSSESPKENDLTTEARDEFVDNFESPLKSWSVADEDFGIDLLSSDDDSLPEL